MTPQQKADQVIERLKHKIEMAIIVFCIIIIAVCCVVGYIVHPMMGKSPLRIGYGKFQRFSMPLGDTTGTEAYEERTVAEHTDDWGIRYVSKQRIK